MSILKSFCVILMAGGLFFLAGCLSPPTRTEVETIIAPSKVDLSQARMGIFSFRAPFKDPAGGSHLAHQFHQLLLARKAAWMIEVIPEDFRDLNDAINRARVLGFDVAVLGQVQEAFYGGDIAASRATVEIRVIDVVRQVTIWYLRGSAKADNVPSKDLLVYRTDPTKASVPLDLIRQLLIEMADQLSGSQGGS